MAKPDASSSTSSSSHGSGSGASKLRHNKIEIDIQKPSMKYNNSESVLVNTSVSVPVVDSTRAHNRKEKERMRKTLRENAKRLKLLEEKMQSISSAVTTTGGAIEATADKICFRMIAVNNSSGQGISKTKHQVDDEPMGSLNATGFNDQPEGRGSSNNHSDGSKMKTNLDSVKIVQFKNLDLCTAANENIIATASVLPQLRCARVPESASRPSSLNTAPSSIPLQTPTQRAPPLDPSVAIGMPRTPSHSHCKPAQANESTISAHYIPNSVLSSHAIVPATEIAHSQSASAHPPRLLTIPKQMRSDLTDGDFVAANPRAMQNGAIVLGEVNKCLPSSPGKAFGGSATCNNKANLNSSSSALAASSAFACKADQSVLTCPDSLDGFAGLQNSQSANADSSLLDRAPVSNSLDLNVSTGAGTKPSTDVLRQIEGVPVYPVSTPSPRRPSWFGVPF